MTKQLPLLTVQNLTIGYPVRQKPDKCIAGPLTVSILPGELVCLLGTNGSGKTTLMRTLAGLLPRLAGEITIGTRSLSALSPPELARQLSVVLTEQIDIGNLTVYELVALGRFPYTSWLGKLAADDDAKVWWALEATDMTAFVGRRTHELSDGERQKVMLARALAQDTPIILLDEPTAHLDLPNRVAMMQLLHGLARKTRKAILLSTHELDLALQAADTLWLLTPNGTLETGAPEDLVLNGTFAASFAKTGFLFDPTTGTFALHNEPPGPAVFLRGDTELLFWTRRALQREGFGLVADARAAALRIDVNNRQGKPIWILHRHGLEYEYSQVAELVVALRNMNESQRFVPEPVQAKS